MAHPLTESQSPDDVAIDALIDELCDQFEAQWKTGNRPSIARWLERGAALPAPELFSQLLAVEIAFRRNAGEVLDAQGFRSQFPAHQTTIDRAFEKLAQESIIAGNSGYGEHTFASQETKLAWPSSGVDPAAEPALHRPGSTETPAPVDRSARLRLFGEIARGGMGAVLKGRDEILGRDIAVKVLLEQHRGNPDLIRRFVEEAQIGGQLQHPGIVPIYELGTFADRRPYFAMKLVKGRTLASRLAARPDPSHDQMALLVILVQVGQTVAYAHARGVIHRDLKPSNVMVGSFGEVQVMDWGLAKVLPRSGAADDAGESLGGGELVITTTRRGSDFDLSRAGSVLGTPAYMAPEQARGEIEAVDERADVFALGSILCEVLSGQPAFTGRSSAEVQRKAARGDLDDALARLDGCGADPELIALARGCLAPERDDRPRDASAFVARLGGYLSSMEQRLRSTEIERARAEARAVEERKRRKLAMALAASLLFIVALGIGGWRIAELQGRQRRDRVQDALAEATLTMRQAEEASGNLEDPLRASLRWAEALDAIHRAELFIGPGVDAGTARRVRTLSDAIKSASDAVERDRKLLGKLSDIRAFRLSRFMIDSQSLQAGKLDYELADVEYGRAFLDYGLNFKTGDLDDAVPMICSRPAPVVAQLVAGLDDWVFFRLIMPQLNENETPSLDRRLLDVSRRVDPDEWRDELRSILAVRDLGGQVVRLRALSDVVDLDHTPVPYLSMLGEMLGAAGESEGGVDFLRRARHRHPASVVLNVQLARSLLALSPPRREEATRYLTAAQSLRPKTAMDLADALIDADLRDEATLVLREVIRLSPESGYPHYRLGILLKSRNRTDEAMSCFDRAISAWTEETIRVAHPEQPHNGLGLAYKEKGDLKTAIEHFSMSVRIAPDVAKYHANLAVAVAELGQRDAAIASLGEAIRLKPDDACLYDNLGFILSNLEQDYTAAEAAFREAIRLQPTDAQHHLNLGIVLFRLGRSEAAVSACREAIRLKPGDVRAHQLLGEFLSSWGRHQDAIAEFREAVRLEPDLAELHFGLARALERSGDLAGRIAEYREGIRLKPDEAGPHYSLGCVLQRSGDLEGAVAAYREAIRLNPDFAEAHCNLGGALRQQGQYAKSLAEYRVGHDLGSNRADWRYPSATWVAEAERLATRAERLPAVLGGTDESSDHAERLSFAQIAYGRRWYAGAARLWSEALESDPSLADDRGAQHRYNAACAAALAAAGKGEDDPKPDDDAKTQLRSQALGWLKAELDVWLKVLDSNDLPARAAVAATLRHWRHDPDLAGVRDEAELARLPEADRADWRALWEEVGRRLVAADRSKNPGIGKLIDEAKLLNERDNTIHNLPTFRGWRSNGRPEPWFGANSAQQPGVVGTASLPARSAMMHPAPDLDVAVGWRSPFQGRVKVEARVAMCDPVGGNGVQWSIVKSSNEDQDVFSQGSLNTGGSQTIPVDVSDPLEIWVQAGDIIFLVIDAKRGDHNCDTTAVELKIVELGGQKRIWNLTEDVVDSIHAGNPHADRFGNADVWRFYAVPVAPRP